MMWTLTCHNYLDLLSKGGYLVYRVLESKKVQIQRRYQWKPWVITMKRMVVKMTSKMMNELSSSVSIVPPSEIPSISINSFNFYYISQFIGKRDHRISFVPRNSVVGGVGIIISVLNFMGKKLKNTKWLTQAVTVRRKKASTTIPPWPGAGTLYYPSLGEHLWALDFFTSLNPKVISWRF